MALTVSSLASLDRSLSRQSLNGFDSSKVLNLGTCLCNFLTGRHFIQTLPGRERSHRRSADWMYPQRSDPLAPSVVVSRHQTTLVQAIATPAGNRVHYLRRARSPIHRQWGVTL